MDAHGKEDVMHRTAIIEKTIVVQYQVGRNARIDLLITEMTRLKETIIIERAMIPQ